MFNFGSFGISFKQNNDIIFLFVWEKHTIELEKCESNSDL